MIYKMLRMLKKSDSCKFSKQKLPYNTCKSDLFMLSLRWKSHYSTLGIDSTASMQDIKNAYYELSFKFHPDKNNGSPESVARFREIAEAYEVLGNPEKKKVYDQDFASTSHSYSEFGGSKYSNPENFRRYSSPRTGRTRDFNYDEHFRKHYEEYYRQQEAEREYFRRRWEADFYRRYPDKTDYFRRRYKNTDHENIFRKPPNIKYSQIFFATWMALLLLHLLVDYFDADQPKSKPGTLYYNVNKSEGNPVDS